MPPGQPRREDYEYQRNGVCSLFIAFEPLAKRRVIQVRAQRTKVDYAHFMKERADKHYPDAESLRVVQDHLNTHSPGSFYEAFPPEEAFRLAQKFEFHYTRKKGSGLNMAEIELSALSKQCLDRRIGDQRTLEKEAQAWARQRNKSGATVQWRFTKQAAREKLGKKYPDVGVQN